MHHDTQTRGMDASTKMELNEASISSSESTASPLSEAIPQKNEPTFMELTCIIEEYKEKLKSLNSLLSPMQLFNPFDAMFTNYQRLKKEYCLQWKQQQSYRQEIRSMLKHNVITPFKTDMNPPSKQYYQHLHQSLPLHEIQTLLQTLQTIQFAIVELFKNCLCGLNEAPIEENRPAVPDHSLYELSKQKQPKRKQKRKKVPKICAFNFNEDRPIPISAQIASQARPKALKLYRKRSSVRSFGALYSDEFRHSIAEHYKESMGFNVEIQMNDDEYSPTKLRMIEFYHDNYIGQNELFQSPFGVRPIIYCDWIASGKPLRCIERYMEQEMLPLYANTHTTASITGQQTSKYRSESRSIILESLGGDHAEDAVIFCGSGATDAIYKLCHVLMKSISYQPATSVVFISIYEHNSNIFIWKEVGIKVIVIPEDTTSEGGIDLEILEQHLQFYTSPPMKQKYNLLIGSFSAASNVSGILAAVDDTTCLLHQYGALSFWDYATAAPYVDVQMTNENNPMLSKDAVFISTHKYLGGPGAPGILCAKRKLFANYTPVVAGGGSVFMAYGVNDGEWQYLDNIEEREEGGTPDIIGSIRAAFVFMIKDRLTTQFIAKREAEYLEYFWRECKGIDNLNVMGNTECDRLPVISLLIQHTVGTETKYLHHNFLAALMNDLFGIQGRGGCACAGMYGKHVLHLKSEYMEHVTDQLREKQNELARPGYFRINLHYTLNKEELRYIINAVKFVCKYGWLFVPLYDVDMKSGTYYHRECTTNAKKHLRSLLDVAFDKKNGRMMVERRVRVRKDHDRGFFNEASNLNTYIESAKDVISNLIGYLPTIDQFENEKCISDCDAWYWLPSELYTSVMDYVQ